MDKPGLLDRLVCRYKNKNFVFWDYLILAGLLALFLIVWGLLTRASNVAISGPFYSKGYKAVYELDGTAAEALGARRLELETVESDDETATVRIKAGDRTEEFVVDRKTAKITGNEQAGLPLVFYYDAVREPNQVSATFGEDKTPAFSTEFTGRETAGKRWGYILSEAAVRGAAFGLAFVPVLSNPLQLLGRPGLLMRFPAAPAFMVLGFFVFLPASALAFYARRRGYSVLAPCLFLALFTALFFSCFISARAF